MTDRRAVLAGIAAAVVGPRAASADARPLLPVRVTVDRSSTRPVAYVYYVAEEHAYVSSSTRIGDTVVVDTNDEGRLFGIELLDLEPVTIAAAAKAAAEHGATFPPDVEMIAKDITGIWAPDEG